MANHIGDRAILKQALKASKD
ncbi:DUF2783 domain-containing protein [Ruegeria sp. Ofav3-42]|nr:DUF2783 domain-containing protein [Ruegeria sp. Ofav3-42]